MKFYLTCGLLFATLLLTGCRHTCGDRPRLFGGRLFNRDSDKNSDDCTNCSNATPVSRSGGFGQLAPGYTGESYPVYPGASSMGTAPSNELPYPRIPSPGVPEGNSATPIPAIPAAGTVISPGSRTTGDVKK